MAQTAFNHKQTTTKKDISNDSNLHRARGNKKVIFQSGFNFEYHIIKRFQSSFTI